MNNNDMIKNGDAMSGNEPTGARRRRKSKVAVWLGVAGICAGGASLIPVGGGTTQAVTGPMSEGMLCTNAVTNTDPSAMHRAFDLVADDGYTSEPDGNAIYDWGYGNRGTGFQLPGPVLCANQGDVIDITLTNKLPVDTSMQFPGQIGVTADGQPDGPIADGSGNLKSLVKQALAPTVLAPNPTPVVYSFTALSAGTYLYESGSDPQLQVQMGLFGAIIIRPRYKDPVSGVYSAIVPSAADISAIPYDGGASPTDTNAQAGVDAGALVTAKAAACAYASPINPTRCDPLSIYSSAPESENILMLSEIDPGVHTFMEQNKATPASLNWNAYPGAYEAHYFMINGRSMPDTIAPNNAPWLPTQPYGAMANVQPWDAKLNPLDSMLHYLAVGTAGYDFHPHSNHEHVIAEDGALMDGGAGHDNTEEKFNIMVAPGSTVDATFRWTNEEGYSDTSAGATCNNPNAGNKTTDKGTGCRVPVSWPNGLNLREGDFWSGSPYLGSTGVLNAGILTKTQCGEYYHVAHNHDLTQVTNYGITFGGMLTLIKVEPPKLLQGTTPPGGDIKIPTCD